MRGYVEMMERLAYNMPEGREPTDKEILDAMANNYAAQIDDARDRADEFPDAPDPEDAITNYDDRRGT